MRSPFDIRTFSNLAYFKFDKHHFLGVANDPEMCAKQANEALKPMHQELIYFAEDTKRVLEEARHELDKPMPLIIASSIFYVLAGSILTYVIMSAV